ncbi:MAG: hypothetical protein K0R57_4074 [Paenibacillaceae bacterium]|nr:hypothetical protein [Paenibacillaceae bacterium]
MSANRTTIGYRGQSFKEGLLTFKASMNLNSGWQGFAIRSSDTQDYGWAGNVQYLLVVKQDVIEAPTVC